MKSLRVIMSLIGTGLAILAFQNCTKVGFQQGLEGGTQQASLGAGTGAGVGVGIDTGAGDGVTDSTGDSGSSGSEMPANEPSVTAAYAACSPFATGARLLDVAVDANARDLDIRNTLGRFSADSARDVRVQNAGPVDVKILRSESFRMEGAVGTVSVVTRNLTQVHQSSVEMTANTVNLGSFFDNAAIRTAITAENFDGQIHHDFLDFCLSTHTISAASSIHDVGGSVVIIGRPAAGEANARLSRIEHVAGLIILKNVDVDTISDYGAIIVLVNSHVKKIAKGAGVLYLRNSVADDVTQSAIHSVKF